MHAWKKIIAFGIKSGPQIILKIKEVANKLKSFLFYVWGLQAEKVIWSIANHNTLCTTMEFTSLEQKNIYNVRIDKQLVLQLLPFLASSKGSWKVWECITTHRNISPRLHKWKGMEPKNSNIFFFAFGPLKTSITQGGYGVHVTNALNLEKMAPLRTRLLGSL